MAFGKYQKLKLQYSYNGGFWADVEPLQFKKGELIEENSTDCGYANLIYRWVNADKSDYICFNQSKYYKQIQQVSYDDGLNWYETGETQTGSLIEANSYDCDYGVTWEKVNDIYYCELPDDGVGYYKYWFKVMPLKYTFSFRNQELNINKGFYKTNIADLVVPDGYVYSLNDYGYYKIVIDEEKDLKPFYIILDEIEPFIPIEDEAQYDKFPCFNDTGYIKTVGQSQALTEFIESYELDLLFAYDYYDCIDYDISVYNNRTITVGNSIEHVYIDAKNYNITFNTLHENYGIGSFYGTNIKNCNFDGVGRIGAVYTDDDNTNLFTNVFDKQSEFGYFQTKITTDIDFYKKYSDKLSYFGLIPASLFDNFVQYRKTNNSIHIATHGDFETDFSTVSDNVNVMYITLYDCHKINIKNPTIPTDGLKFIIGQDYPMLENSCPIRRRLDENLVINYENFVENEYENYIQIDFEGSKQYYKNLIINAKNVPNVGLLIKWFNAIWAEHCFINYEDCTNISPFFDSLKDMTLTIKNSTVINDLLHLSLTDVKLTLENTRVTNIDYPSKLDSVTLINCDTETQEYFKSIKDSYDFILTIE